MRTPLIFRVTAALALLFTALPVLAQDPTGGGAPPAAPGDASAAAVAPVLQEHADPIYPADALRDRIAGTVGLEIVIDETGKVVDAKVVQPGGHGFDEAALAAAKGWTFLPARVNDQPSRATVQLSLPFEPPAVSPSVPAVVETPKAGAPSAPPPELQKNTETTLVLGRRPMSAASASAVRDRDFALRPIGSVQDILRVTPGLVMVQHSGGGKANQYFLRGFDADHGTDLALSIDGIPINMVSHAHGQGFADTNFIIPEVVERVQITKGPYFAYSGDLATSGAVNMVSRDDFAHSSAAAGLVGSPGHGSAGTRGLAIASPKLATTGDTKLKATVAAEIG